MTIPQSRSSKFSNWVMHALELQLFLSLISLPLLISWGLPLSAMAILSNLIFGPILSIFLTLSSLILLCEIIGIPNTIPIYALELITHSWRWILSWQQPSWMIGFAKPHALFLCAQAIATVIIISRRSWTRPVRIYALLILGCLTWAASHLSSRYNPDITYLPCNSGSIIMVHHNNQTVVIDPGYIAQRPGAPSWIQYTFAPWLIKRTGSVIIDHLIILQPSSRIFEAVTGLSTKLQIKNMYIPYWQGTLSTGGWRNFFLLTQELTKKMCHLKRIGSYRTRIPLSDTGSIIITPCATDSITSGQYTYQATRVTCMIDKQETSFYAAKHSTCPQKNKESVGEKSITDHCT